MKIYESNIRELWDNIKQVNLRIIGIPEGEEKETGLKIYLRKLWLKTVIKIQEAQRAPNKLNPNKPRHNMLNHIIC